ncbi:conserved hypothetical protein [Perkinsus marinus ATCC 50983]|uniref:RING-type domain-containing protein n=1 Tax=Perkinsus marinus (strain ATCC 50983 / TXsc) TaxID=423536 RepID=C5KV78_PERM5|nr:conserved hypothetical protein [Perkinsus marinus ATCC 50983]EER11624.1 conserved hypothetical protein [Perkinsus marinus ATCC 50983]|eukprot:XP_002779829.1 conserved hypothetical protein [Perkinsus marinus ATCC 50983]
MRAKKPKRAASAADSDGDTHSSELERQLESIRQENELLKERLQSVTNTPSIANGFERRSKRSVVEPCKNQPTPMEKARGRLFADLECVICRDLMVSPATLECSHSFCYKCIEEWLTGGNFRCPVCRVGITRSPTKTIQLQQVVMTTVETHGTESDQAEYDDRMKEHKAWERKQETDRAKLEDTIGSASHKGQQFFDIALPWNSEDKARFQAGIRHYRSDARELYCAITGLTKAWIQRSSRDSLDVAMKNLKIGTIEAASAEDSSQVCYAPDDVMRRRLLLFTRYC